MRVLAKTAVCMWVGSLMFASFAHADGLRPSEGSDEGSCFGAFDSKSLSDARIAALTHGMKHCAKPDRGHESAPEFVPSPPGIVQVAPIPEPSMLALLLGLGGLFSWRRPRPTKDE